MGSSIRSLSDWIGRISGKLARDNKSQLVNRGEIGLIPRSGSVYISATMLFE